MGSSVFLKTGNYAKKKVIEHLKSNQVILPGSKIPMQENKNHKMHQQNIDPLIL